MVRMQFGFAANFCVIAFVYQYSHEWKWITISAETEYENTD